MATQYWNAHTQKLEEETIYGENPMKWLYQTSTGRWMEKNLLSSRWFSVLYGNLQSQPFSRHKIQNFVTRFKIPMEEFEENSFSSFNDFFIRKFKPKMRNFSSSSNILPSFAEGRMSGYDKLDAQSQLLIKGQQLTPSLLFGPKGADWVSTFEGGPCIVARLCPVDYHRYHYPDNGRTLDAFEIDGKFHSVHTIALKEMPGIFCENYRRLAILETENFGKLAYLEVGAICVGKIVQSYPESKSFKRGDEKGYFLFGGSTVVIFGEPGKWKPLPLITEHTSRGIETLVRLGAPLGEKS